MKYTKLLGILSVFLLSGQQGMAQKRILKPQSKNVKTNLSKTIESEGTRMFQTMLTSTAKVMFIDSMVVSKASFMSMIPLSHDLGTITSQRPAVNNEVLGMYENNFGDRRILAAGDTTRVSLYAQTLLGNSWSKPTILAGIDQEDYAFQNFPFLSSDGVTLFFSAKGPHSMGGRDIFMTVYDTDRAEWYQPQNYGLPYNSTANDYLLAIDDINSLGWLVTDRFQAKDSVCIYTFVPTTTRQDFSNDNLTDKQLQHFAKIKSIKDTWQFGDRAAAIARRDALMKQKKTSQSTPSVIFVVDNTTNITSVDDFKSAESKRLYQQLREVKALFDETTKTLDKKRKDYHAAEATRRIQISEDILRLEKELPKQHKDILAIEKQIRTAEKKH